MTCHDYQNMAFYYLILKNLSSAICAEKALRKDKDINSFRAFTFMTIGSLFWHFDFEAASSMTGPQDIGATQ